MSVDVTGEVQFFCCIYWKKWQVQNSLFSLQNRFWHYVRSTKTWIQCLGTVRNTKSNIRKYWERDREHTYATVEMQGLPGPWIPSKTRTKCFMYEAKENQIEKDRKNKQTKQQQNQYDSQFIRHPTIQAVKVQRVYQFCWDCGRHLAHSRTSRMSMLDPNDWLKKDQQSINSAVTLDHLISSVI